MKRNSRRIQRCKPFFEYLCIARSPQTAEQYAYAAERFLSWLEERGVAEIGEAKPSALAEYCEELGRRGFNQSTISVQVSAIRRYCDWLKRQDFKIPEFYSPDRVRVMPRRVRDALTPEQIEQYLDNASSLRREPIRTAAILLASTGLRSGEIVMLDLGCARKITVTLADKTEKVVWGLLVQGKGGHERVCPIVAPWSGFDDGVEDLRTYLREWRAHRVNSRWLFPGNQAGHLAAHTLRKAVASIRPDGVVWTPHTLRRTYLTSLYRLGVDPIVLAKIAGHTDVRTLLQHYLAIDEQDVFQAIHRKVS